MYSEAIFNIAYNLHKQRNEHTSVHNATEVYTKIYITSAYKNIDTPC